MSEIDFDLSLTEIMREIVKFNNDPTAQRLRTYYNEKTYPEILGVSRRELSHSSFLAWIVDPTASHGIGDFGVRRLLEILMTSKFCQINRERQMLFGDLTTGNFKIVSSSVQREVGIGREGRVDVLVELHFSEQTSVRIVIENKVLSTEGNDQTNRYVEYYDNLKDSYINLFVYLTPLSSLDLKELDEPECKNKNFIQINYQGLVDSLLEPAMEKAKDTSTRFVIRQYIQSLSQPSMEQEENDFKREMIMAIGKDEKELLKKFWDGNQKVILAALYAISVDNNQDDDVREKVEEALESIVQTGRDHSLITIRYNNKNHDPIRKSDIGTETVRLLVENNRIDDDVFNWLCGDYSCSLKLLKTKEEVTEQEAKHRYRIQRAPELVYNNKEYYVARNWGIGNIGKFISKVEKKFPEIKYEIMK